MTGHRFVESTQKHAQNAPRSPYTRTPRRDHGSPSKMERSPRDISLLMFWGSISRSTNLVGSKRDRGWRVVHNRYPVAMEPLGMRNAAWFDGLGRVGGLGRKRDVRATRACGPAGVAWQGRRLVAMLQGV